MEPIWVLLESPRKISLLAKGFSYIIGSEKIHTWKPVPRWAIVCLRIAFTDLTPGEWAEWKRGRCCAGGIGGTRGPKMTKGNVRQSGKMRKSTLKPQKIDWN